MEMKSVLLAIAVVVIASGCAVQPIDLASAAKATSRAGYRKIVIDNLSSEQKIAFSEVIYVNGWAPMHTGFRPALNDAFVSKLRTGLEAAGPRERLDVSVLRAGLFVEKSVADDIAFIGFLTLVRERGFKCDADINLKHDDKSIRQTVSHEIRRKLFDSQQELAAFVDDCHHVLIRKVAEEANSL